MGIETGFFQTGFKDDVEEKNRWSQLEERLNGKSKHSNQSGDSADEEEPKVEGTLNIDDSKEWVSDAEKSVGGQYKSTKPKTFLQRNKRQIIDAVIVLGVIYVAYKLFWEKDGDEFGEGGDVEMQSAPAPQPVAAPAPQTAPPPPRVEMPEPTYNPEG